MSKAAEFEQIHAPGRFDATLDQAQAAWDEFRSHADVALITATEYGSGKFDRALEADGWDHFRGDGEGVIAWRTDEFAAAWHGSADRIGSTFFRGGNSHAQTPLASMPLRHLATGTLLMARVPHAPAHVQAGDGFRKTTARVIEQGAAWVSAMAALGRRTRRFKRHHKNAAELVAADFNVDVHRRHWRSVLRAALGLRCAKPLPMGGDLGKRLVSWVFQRGLKVLHAALMPKFDGFDHRPIRIRYRIKES